MKQSLKDGARATLRTSGGDLVYFRLGYLEERGLVHLPRLPYSIRVLLENALRSVDGYLVTDDDVLAVANWDPKAPSSREFPFMPARVLMQDFTGVPAVVDLAAMRSAIARQGGDPKRVNPLVPVDLVIDHSVQVDYFGSSTALQLNVRREFERNQERYVFLRWAQKAFANLSVVPPGTGIVHQVNLEYLAKVVIARQNPQGMVAFPDTVVGTDSHTTMVNGLGVLGWGVGGIEAEAVLLGQPYYMQLPEVIGFKLTGTLSDGVTATDLVLTITQMLRQRGVVEKFVEFYGPGLSKLPLPDRATIANMAPEYGATCGFFPIDEVTLEYLRGTGRERGQVELVERYAQAQGLFRTDEAYPQYTDSLALDMGEVEPSLAGPRRPQDRVALGDVKKGFSASFKDQVSAGDATQTRFKGIEVVLGGQKVEIGHGAVVISAITSCTNTSNPSVMVGSGLLAKKAVERGLATKPWVKTSMSPGSQVVTEYLKAAGLTPYLERLGFHTVGYGCTTCIGNSGPLPEPVSQAIKAHDLVVAAVLSGNRNFEGRIHPEIKANYLASPLLVVAYALAGSVDVDLALEPLGHDQQGNPVFLRDIWPSQAEIHAAMAAALKPEMFRDRYAQVFLGPEEWRALPVPEGDLYRWDARSTYIQEPPFFKDLPLQVSEPGDILGARVLVMVGDSITTDHISPAGSIPADRPAGRYLIGAGVQPRDFNTFGARRGNHDVMMRGTFGNVRLRNRLTPDKEGDWTVYLPDGQPTSIFEAAMRYRAGGIPTIVIAGKEYGAGSSRDWAAKGPYLLGVRAALAESYERIHRSNLVGMGVLPLQFKRGESGATLGLSGREVYDIQGIAQGLKPGQEVHLRAARDDGTAVTFSAITRIDNKVEVEYYRQGGVLNTVLRRMLKES
ncbi:MAG: aconitate hydratase AcnA [Dehalococcoidia bacterium]|nr:aconitate hydratase AcnA [Dehalococcoidia bacterium]